MSLADSFFGYRNFFCKSDPNIMVRIPAKKNLVPAKRIWDITSDDSIPNKAYPILIHGNALPHNRQQRMASRNTTILLLKVDLFSMY